MSLVEDRIVADTADGPMTALVWHPDGGGSFPAVVLYHDGPGLRESIFDTARRLAAAGYLVAVPDLYHRHGELIRFDVPKLHDPDSPERKQFFHIVMTTTPELMVADTAALIPALDAHPAASAGPRACIGFCHTARTVILAMGEMADRFPVGVMMHPSFAVTDSPNSPHTWVKKIDGELYAAFGGADTTAPLTEQQPLIDELTKLGKRAKVDILPNAGHGFLWSDAPGYDLDGAESAWEATFELFDGHLKTTPPAPISAVANPTDTKD